ncbi:keratinocyte proline-rich protein-like [Camellia sinensis]|uniref:keratinocyte proline-rich protein-like n=1 Tax=Camellia sinensis TaxID=4442 RepID=UPI00103567AC|nr:keratinocyte proline-rich protein-like [Camellia sinensis]
MDPMPKQTIEHFTHPGHQLEQIYAKTEYTCDGCKTHGQGSRYQCNSKSCCYVLHDYCGTCPPSLSSFMHPQHPLTLVVRNPQQSTRQNDRYCDVCREPVEGLFYRCKDCDFDVHPLCTQLPRQLRHALDHSHLLTFEAPVLPSPCSVCGAVCSSWRYRCGVCGLDIHLECLLKPCVPPTQQRSVRPSGPNPNHPPPYPLRPPPPLPYGHPPPYPLPPPLPYGHPPPYPLPPPLPYGHPPQYPLPPPSPYGHPPPYPLPPPYGHPLPYPLPPPYGHPPPYPMSPPYGHPQPYQPPKLCGYGNGSGYADGVPSGYGYGNGSGVPSGHSDNYNIYNNGNQAQGHGETFKKFGKRMFLLVAQLTLGVVSNGIFGLAFPF